MMNTYPPINYVWKEIFDDVIDNNELKDRYDEIFDTIFVVNIFNCYDCRDKELEIHDEVDNQKDCYIYFYHLMEKLFKV